MSIYKIYKEYGFTEEPDITPPIIVGIYREENLTGYSLRSIEILAEDYLGSEFNIEKIYNLTDDKLNEYISSKEFRFKPNALIADFSDGSSIMVRAASLDNNYKYYCEQNDKTIQPFYITFIERGERFGKNMPTIYARRIHEALENVIEFYNYSKN